MSNSNCPCMEECPLQSALHVIGGKWKIMIICALNQEGVARYNQLMKKVRGITNTMLASSLKELERDGLVRRCQYNEIPVRVEYSLTESAASLLPILGQMAQWGAQRQGIAPDKAASQ